MNKSSVWISRSSFAAMTMALCTPAFAQSVPDAPEVEPAADDIVVTGIRRSLEASNEVKRRADSIVDVITAEDIGKLPDQNVAESLSRVTGVQITRRDGDGSGFTVRGISQNRIEINGRTFIGPSPNGDPSLEALNPEILSSIEVVKSPTADRIEGALGAIVNLRTKRPLELSDLVVAGRLQGAYGDLGKKLGYRGSALVSFRTDDRRFGILVGAAHNSTTTGAFGFSTGGWSRVNAIDGNGDGIDDPNLFRPNRIQPEQFRREEERSTLNAAVQFVPTPSLAFTADLTYSDLRRDRNTVSLQTLLTNNDVGARAASDGTVFAGTFTGVTLRPTAAEVPTRLKSLNTAANVKYTADRFTASLDGSYSRGRGQDSPTGSPFIYVVNQRAGRTVAASYDLSARRNIPDFSLNTNFDINDPSQYQLASVFDLEAVARNDGYDGRIDLSYSFAEGGFFKSLSLGARYERLQLFSAEPQNLPTAAALLAAGDRNRDGILTVDELPGLNYDNSFGPYAQGQPGTFLRTWLTGTVDRAIARPGLGLPFPSLSATITQGPTTVKDVDQRTLAGYVRLDIDGEIGSMPFRGNLGVRYLTTDRTSRGFAQGANLTVPVAFDAKFDGFLPSVNLTLDVTDQLIARFAAAKVIARPSLTDVGAGLLLNTVNFTATRGNPQLGPYKATQADLSVEWYFAKAGLLSFAAFYKDIQSFTVQTVTQETIPGFERFGPFSVNQPTNGDRGSVRGVELSFQQAFTFLPSPFDGLGVQLNYTYADSKTPIIDQLTSRTLPLPGLSKHSYSAIGYFERGIFGARIAYTWRDQFLEAVQSSLVGGSRFNNSRGQLDGSAFINLDKRFRLTFEAVNLTAAENRRYSGVDARLFNVQFEERRFFFGVAASF